ncbi:MAG TPA: histidine kinase [Candidatus Limnocylindrales bacterium]|nr:histidine kinase [Candidatus Limnocylindrales bacterium]
MTSLRAALANPILADSLLAAALTGLSIVTLLAGARDIGSLDPGSIALLLLQTVPLVARRIAPLPVFGLTGAATILHALAAQESLSTTLGSLIALFTVAERFDRRISIPAALALGGAMGLLIAYRTVLPGSLGGLVQTELAVLVSWTLGTWSRERHAYIGTVEQRAQRAETDREERAHRAVAAERERIARELHDVVTHHVSVIVLQAGVARRVLAKRPDDAAAAIAAIDRAGRQALTEMRRMLGILGQQDAPRGEPLEPMPGLDRLGELIESVRAAGLPVELSVSGDRPPLDPGVELSAYRIIQEALTNTMKHARGARARVAVRFEPGAVEVRVSDRGGTGSHELADGGSGGHGLIGMRERVAMLGGEFEAGRDDGGFRVRARLPLVSPEAVS